MSSIQPEPSTQRTVRHLFAPLECLKLFLLVFLLFSRTESLFASHLDLNEVRLLAGFNKASAQDPDDEIVKIDYDDGSWGSREPISQDATGTVNAEIKWVVSKISPRTGHHLLGLQYKALNVDDIYFNLLYQLTSDDPTSGWTQVSTFPTFPVYLGVVGNAYEQLFDIAVQNRKGNFLVVYRKPRDVNDANYPRKLFFFELRPSFAPAPAEIAELPSHVRWIRLVEDPLGQEILLLALDDSSMLFSWKWDGSAWTPLVAQTVVNRTNVISTSLAPSNHQGFDAAYEESGGTRRTVVVYQESSLTKYRVRDVGSASWGNAKELVNVQSQYVDLTTQPRSNKIALGLYYSNKVRTAMWDGNSTSPSCATPSPGASPDCFLTVGLEKTKLLDDSVHASELNSGNIPLALGWAGDTAIIAYSDTTIDGSNGLDWAKWTGSGWTVQPDALGLPNIGEAGFLSESYYPTRNELLLAFGDFNKSLYTARYDGSVFTELTNQTGAGGRSLSSFGTNYFAGRPFSFSINRYTLPKLTEPVGLVRLPVYSGGAVIAFQPTLQIEDPGGLIQKGEPIAPTETRDIAISLPATATWKIKWNKGPICLSGSAITNGKVKNSGPDATVCPSGFKAMPDTDVIFSQDQKTIFLNVLEDFAFGETLRINKLAVTYEANADTTDPAPLKVEVNIQSDSDPAKNVDVSLADSLQLQLVEGLELRAPATQVPNAFTTVPTIPEKPLLRVAFWAKGNHVRLTSLAFSSQAAGVNVGPYRLKDEQTEVIVPSTPQAGLTFNLTSSCDQNGNGNFCIAKDSTETFLLLGAAQDLNGTDPAETATLTLPVSGIKAVGSFTGIALETVPEAIHGIPQVAKTHTVSTYTITSPTAGESVVVGNPWTITFNAFGDANNADVSISYQTDGGSWTILCNPATAIGECRKPVPDKPSTNAKIKIKDNARPIEVVSDPFTIAARLQLESTGADDLNGNAIGGETWVVGKPYTIQWKQAGSFQTNLELSKDDGGTWPISIFSGPKSAPTETTFTVGYQPQSTDITKKAKLRVRPNGDIPFVGNNVSGTFEIQPAFQNIEPGNQTKAVIKGKNLSISWTRLAGTEPGSFVPINNVTVKVLDSLGNVLQIENVPQSFTMQNIGSFSWTAPNQPMTGLKIKICDVAVSTICAMGGDFNVIEPSLQVSPLPGPYYRIGENVTIKGGQGFTGDVRLKLLNEQKLPIVNISDQPIQVGLVNSNNGYTWQIPVTLQAPLKNVSVRLESSTNPAVFVDSDSFTIHGVLRDVVISPTPVLLEKTPPDSSNDVTIQWTALGVPTVKLWLKRSGDLVYQPLSGFGAPGADTASGTTFPWTNILSTAKTTQARIRITQENDKGCGPDLPPNDYCVWAESWVFKIIGELRFIQLNKQSFDINNLLPDEILLKWETVRGPINQVILRVLDQSTGNPVPLNSQGSTELELDNFSSSNSFVWKPLTTYQTVKAKVCDTADLAVCANSIPFTVGGIQVEAPRSGDRFVIGPTGASIFIKWKPVGGSGNVKLSYQIGQTETTIIDSIQSQENVLNVYEWKPTVNFADLSSQVIVKVKDLTNPLEGKSTPFTIAGQMKITSVTPQKPNYEVGENIKLNWDYYGSISSAKLQYSPDGITWKDGPSVNPALKSYSNWEIPLDAISNSLRLRVVDTTPGHPDSESPPFIITVTPRLTLTLPDPSPWVANETHPITWSTTGLIQRVQLLYSVNGGQFFPMEGTPLANGIVENSTNDPNWNGSFSWKVADRGLDRDPTHYERATLKIKVVDASAGHVPIERLSNPVSLIYLKVIWQVLDLTTQDPLTNLSVNETSATSGETTWNVTNDSVMLTGQTPAGILRYYPVDSYHTTWTKKTASSPAVVSGWLVDRTQLVDFNNDGQIDPAVDGIIKQAFLELDVNKQIPWSIHQRFQFVPGNPNRLDIMGWLERRGVLFNLVKKMNVEIRTESELIATLSSTTPDAVGVFRIPWDIPTGPNEDQMYFAKATVTLSQGGTLTSGEALAIGNLRRLMGAGGGGQFPSEVTTKLDEVHAQVVGPGSSLEQVRQTVTTLPTMISAAQTAIQHDILAVGEQVASVKTDTEAIKADTTSVKTTLESQVVPKVTAILESETVGLPFIRQQTKQLQRGAILNRETELEPNQKTKILYRSGGGAPTLGVYDANGNAIFGPLPMMLNSTGLYESTVQLTSVGDYNVVVSEPASANSAVTIDSLTLAVRAPKAGGSGGSGLATGQLDALSHQVANLEASLNSLLKAAGSIQQTSNETRELAKQLHAQAQSTLNQLAGLSPSGLTAELKKLGTEPLMDKLKELQSLVASAQGSTAAVGFSQSAFSAASQAVEILKKIQDQLKSPSPAALAPLLAQYQGAMGEVAEAAEGIPGAISSEGLGTQLQEAAEQMKALSSENGYTFDLLYQMTETQAGDVKAVRNRVEELKALLELQRMLLEQKLNDPVIKTWFELG